VNKTRSFFSELLRRKVVRLLGAYIAIFWLLATGLSDILPKLTFVPEWSFQAFIVTGIALIPVLAFFSWKYDVVPPHLVRDAKDIEEMNPALSWARRRHSGIDAGYLLLKWRAGDETAHEKLAFEPVSIGREPTNQIQLEDKRVSRYHAVVWAQDRKWYVRDVNSANGTFVDGTRVTGAAVLPSSCSLRFHPDGPVVQAFVSKSAETFVSTEIAR
jgi:FHA domain